MAQIWYCKIGETDHLPKMNGADYPMRQAIRAAYLELTGEEPEFIFSGWGQVLTEGERACVDDDKKRREAK